MVTSRCCGAERPLACRITDDEAATIADLHDGALRSSQKWWDCAGGFVRHQATDPFAFHDGKKVFPGFSP
jgi:hypothetical protein